MINVTESEEKAGSLNDRQKILVLIGIILVLFGVAYAYDDMTAIVFLWLSYYGVYLLMLTLTDREGISFPNVYKIVIAILALLGVWAISRAWIMSSFWAGVGPDYGAHVETIVQAIIEILEYLKQYVTDINLWTPPPNGVVFPP